MPNNLNFESKNKFQKKKKKQKTIKKIAQSNFSGLLFAKKYLEFAFIWAASADRLSNLIVKNLKQKN